MRKYTDNIIGRFGAWKVTTDEDGFPLFFVDLLSGPGEFLFLYRDDNEFGPGAYNIDRRAGRSRLIVRRCVSDGKHGIPAGWTGYVWFNIYWANPDLVQDRWAVHYDVIDDGTGFMRAGGGSFMFGAFEGPSPYRCLIQASEVYGVGIKAQATPSVPRDFRADPVGGVPFRSWALEP